MSILTSKFDVQSVETHLALAGLAQVFDVGVGAASGLYTGAGVPNSFLGGTPLPGAVLIPPGAIVAIDNAGLAQLASAPVLWIDATGTSEVAHALVRAGDGAGLPIPPVLPFVALDGNTDFSGAFVRKITAVHGGMTIATDQWDNAVGAFVIGKPVTFFLGKIVPLLGIHAFKQIFGFVGPAGLNAVEGVLQVLIPQGAGSA